MDNKINYAVTETVDMHSEDITKGTTEKWHSLGGSACMRAVGSCIQHCDPGYATGSGSSSILLAMNKTS